MGPCKVLKIRDYLKHTVLDLATGAVTPPDLPESNVLYYELENDAWMCVRPSGTEPKVKFYLGVKGSSAQAARGPAEDIEGKPALLNGIRQR